MESSRNNQLTSFKSHPILSSVWTSESLSYHVIINRLSRCQSACVQAALPWGAAPSECSWESLWHLASTQRGAVQSAGLFWERLRSHLPVLVPFYWLYFIYFNLYLISSLDVKIHHGIHDEETRAHTHIYTLLIARIYLTKLSVWRPLRKADEIASSVTPKTVIKKTGKCVPGFLKENKWSIYLVFQPFFGLFLKKKNIYIHIYIIH